MPDDSPNSAWTRRRLLLGAAALAAAGAAALCFFDPATCPFYPRCPLHELTGWSCPGCGTLRAAHQLLRGHFAAAWQLNPLAVSLAPAALWLGLREWVWQFYGKRWPGLVTRPLLGWAAAALALIFGIARNLPGFHP
jgi:hypothetical protein